MMIARDVLTRQCFLAERPYYCPFYLLIPETGLDNIMRGYVDGFFLAVPKKKLQTYRRLEIT